MQEKKNKKRKAKKGATLTRIEVSDIGALQSPCFIWRFLSFNTSLGRIVFQWKDLHRFREHRKLLSTVAIYNT